MNSIQDLIARGRLKDALNELMKNAQSADLKNEIVLQQGRLSSLERNERLGTISYSDANIERARITAAALDLAGRADEKPSSPTDRTSSFTSSPASETEGTSRPRKIFFSYSKYDKEYLEQLQRHLAGLRRQGKIEPWSDKDTLAGEDWDEEIKQRLAEADIILLLVSADFLATDYIWDIEIKAAMERHERREARVIPVIIRPCEWQDMPFGKLMGLPSKGRPVATFAHRDEAWLEVVKGIQRVL